MSHYNKCTFHKKEKATQNVLNIWELYDYEVYE